MVFWGHSVFVEKPPDIWFDLYFSHLIRVHTEDNWIFWSSAEVLWGKTVKIQRQQSSRLCLPSIYVRRIQRGGAGGVALLCGSPCLILVKNQQKKSTGWVVVMFSDDVRPSEQDQAASLNSASSERLESEGNHAGDSNKTPVGVYAVSFHAL